MEKILNFGRKLIPKRIFRFFQPAYHYILAVTGNLTYRFPGKKLICIGVTGTNGKSTTIEIINSILKAQGYKTGMISTVAFEIAGKRNDNITSRTTLGRWQTPKMLRRMVKAGCKYAVIEAASEGIAWYRTWGIPFDVAVFTNLSPEHLNFHKTMKNYRNTKGKLFANLSLGRKKKKIEGKRVKIKKVNIVNADDKEAGYFGAFPADEHFDYGIKKGDTRAINIRSNQNLEFEISYLDKKYPIKSNLMANFNVLNILAAWCVGFSQGIEPNVIAEGINNVKKIKGRMEKVAEKNSVTYYIDYAVTPDSFELLFAELRKITKGKIIAVFGATGNRDKGKRPHLGEAAAKGADTLVITDEEPYNEKPEDIIKEVVFGAEKIRTNDIYQITNREKALKKAIELACPGDTVVATGMGHQKYRNVGGNKKIEWDEAEVIKKLLK